MLEVLIKNETTFGYEITIRDKKNSQRRKDKAWV